MLEALEMSQYVMDAYAARILLATFDRPVSALELSRKFGIPIAACYRRIRELESMGLVFCESSAPSRNGKGLQLFRSCLKSVRISLEEGLLRARVELHQSLSGAAAPPQVREQVINLMIPGMAPA
jgi:predicted ArsR family transcriptional regulator